MEPIGRDNSDIGSTGVRLSGDESPAEDEVFDFVAKAYKAFREKYPEPGLKR